MSEGRLQMLSRAN